MTGKEEGGWRQKIEATSGSARNAKFFHSGVVASHSERLVHSILCPRLWWNPTTHASTPNASPGSSTPESVSLQDNNK